MLCEQRTLEEVEIVLPGGERARFRLHGQGFSPDAATCFVVKDAGDDPDVTHGAEIHVTVSLLTPDVGADPRVCPGRTRGFAPTGLVDGQVVIEGGTGIGRVTKPGLAVPVGEWAINPVPRRMITEAVLPVFTQHPALSTQHGSRLVPHVVISIPNGEELARKTLNARLGIIGGLSILGTTGIVRPVSARAWTDTIDTAIDVALACGCRTLVFSTGRTSERAAQNIFSRSEVGAGNHTPGEKDLLPLALLPLPDEAYIMMGDHVGHALRSASRRGVEEIVLAAQFAKLLKIACGHEQTHVDSSRLDLRSLAGWLDDSPRASRLKPCAARAHTARELFESTSGDPGLVDLVCSRARRCAERFAPGLGVKVFLAGYGGEMVYFR
jgi:cobalt-precorrin-5B (C1)-methyltransferase